MEEKRINEIDNFNKRKSFKELKNSFNLHFKKLLEKYGKTIWIIGFIPACILPHAIGLIIGLDSWIIVCFQLPLLFIQIFCCLLSFRYKKEIFSYRNKKRFEQSNYYKKHYLN